MIASELESFLLASADADGVVKGWTTGRPYPEIGGYLLKWLVLESAFEPAERVARWLETQLSERGAIGRDGDDYLFDSAIVLDALERVAAADLTLDTSATRQQLRRFIETSIDDRCAYRSTHELEPRWSTRYGAHLRKLALVIEGERLDRLPALHPEPYAHARCYALEGLWLAGSVGPEFYEGVEELTERQRRDGGIESLSRGPVRADATAQAVRLWIAADAARYADAIERGLACLAGLQETGGGMRYGEDSSDINVWASIFTHQALRWAEAGRPISPLI